MKRDHDFIRELLFEAEASDQDLLIFDDLNPSPEVAKRKVHALLLCDAGFFQKNGLHLYRLTNQGYDYLASVRDDGIWKKTKEAAAKVGGVTLVMFKDIAISYLKAEIAQKLGINL